jgi:hypothetical protein
MRTESKDLKCTIHVIRYNDTALRHRKGSKTCKAFTVIFHTIYRTPLSFVTLKVLLLLLLLFVSLLLSLLLLLYM